MDITLLIPLQQMAYLPFCATIITLTVVERRNPILTEPSADTVLLVSYIPNSWIAWGTNNLRCCSCLPLQNPCS